MPTNIEVEILGSPSGSNRTMLQYYGELATITTVLDCTPTNGVQRVVFRAVNGGKNRIKSSVLIDRVEAPTNRAPVVSSSLPDRQEPGTTATSHFEHSSLFFQTISPILIATH